ncbi:MAG: DUF167 domain-containing protein [Pseudomonadota bacterium]
MSEQDKTFEITERGDRIIFQILVVPGASREQVGPVVGDRVKVVVNAPPVDGKANLAVVRLLARSIGVLRRDVEIISGQQGKRKTIQIFGVTAKDLLRIL